jgi:tetratricopeptide (TPR) repeat protein
LKKVVELKPDNASAHDLLARVYLNLKKFGSAKDHYLEVIQLDPSKCEVQANVGYCFMLLNDPASAVPYYKKAVSCFPRDVNDLLSLAKALELTKNLDEAYEYYLKILQIDPKNKDANDGRDRIDMQRY